MKENELNTYPFIGNEEENDGSVWDDGA